MRVPTLQHLACRFCPSDHGRWFLSSAHGSRTHHYDRLNVARLNVPGHGERLHSTRATKASWIEDGRADTSAAFHWHPLPGVADAAAVASPSQKSYFGILCSAMGGATHANLQQLASAVTLPRGRGRMNSLVDRVDALPAGPGSDSKSRQIVAAAAQRVDFGSTDGTELARELVAATLIAAQAGSGPGVEQWARALLAAALAQYRDVDSRLEFDRDGADFRLKCFDMYAQMIDLLAAWNLFCDKYQTGAVEADERSNNDSVDAYTYQQQFMSLLPGLSSSSSSSYRKVSTDCEQDLVFASFITLALMTKLRYRMLRGLDVDAADANARLGAVASTDASLLNLRNVSLPEAAFLRLVGQAGQGTPFNRIHLRLVWARIGCSPTEAQSIGRTIENLHAYHDYLLVEADRCFAAVAAADASGTAMAMAPALLLAWIHYADAHALGRFREGLLKWNKGSISAHALWPELLSAITRRLITVRRQKQRAEDPGGSEEAAAEILRTVKAWVALGPGHSGGTGPLADALEVLDHFRDADDDLNYAAAWSTLRSFPAEDASSPSPSPLEAHFRAWARHLWTHKEYDRVVSLHRYSVQLLSEKRLRSNDHACRLTQICLELQVQDAADRGVHSQRIFHNLVRLGIEPDRQLWRQWMRVKAAALQFLNAARALWRYKMCQAKGDADEQDDLLWEEAGLYMVAYFDKIKADERVLLKDILFDISRAVSIGLQEADCEKLPMLRKPARSGSSSEAQAVRVISIHERLVQRVCDLPPAPNRLKLAAAIHMHLLHCISPSGPTLAARVSRLEEMIARAFWQTTSSRSEQMQVLCRQRYTGAWPPMWASLPVVKAQNLVRAWLGRGLAERRLSLSFDLDDDDAAATADVGAYVAKALDMLVEQKGGSEAAAVKKYLRAVAREVSRKEKKSLERGASERTVSVVVDDGAEKGASSTAQSVTTPPALPIRRVALRRPRKR